MPVNCTLFSYTFIVFKVLEGRSYRLQHPWVGIVNRSQADINRNVDMIYARRKEREYFTTSPDYGHLASKMGSEYLAKLLSQVCSLEVALFPSVMRWASLIMLDCFIAFGDSN